MTVAAALEFFSEIPGLQRKLQTLSDVGLGYIRIGQQATTLSGGGSAADQIVHGALKSGDGEHALHTR